jgi:hypothetical protein
MNKQNTLIVPLAFVLSRFVLPSWKSGLSCRVNEFGDAFLQLSTRPSLPRGLVGPAGSGSQVGSVND